MSPAASADRPGPLRLSYGAELEQLRLQTEVMALRVDQNLERMRVVLTTGDALLAEQALAADDEIDAMNVSLTERCYEVLARETPVASDLRLVVSVIRATSELERVGDLCLRVVKAALAHELLVRSPRSFDILCVMADEAIAMFRDAIRAWGTDDLELATRLATGPHPTDLAYVQLVDCLVGLDGPDAAAIAMQALLAGQALDRITDHAAILGTRLRYLITGDPNHLAAEVRR
jgi:phosphate transport system protein